jgi:hypothetical protein
MRIFFIKLFKTKNKGYFSGANARFSHVVTETLFFNCALRGKECFGGIKKARMPDGVRASIGVRIFRLSSAPDVAIRRERRRVLGGRFYTRAG